ncbi:conserved hypothetical protein [Coccidioides posadasii str. Silveira]|uniref:Uncharacterized protein n=1 Tax=Coccidioides posadasii (strain RMSCC 757 / Silveira) TaxID=443226 RepID=E9DIR9_COCPS|nr:conserved hypothetical protein [Coccidioides posadasii str. Silveira]
MRSEKFKISGRRGHAARSGGKNRQGTRVAGGERGRRLNADGNLPSQWRYMWLARMRVRGKKQFQTYDKRRGGSTAETIL